MDDHESIEQVLHVRVWSIQSDGVLEPLMGAGENHFRGTIPDVGDTFVMFGPSDEPLFYSVQRRYFINSNASDHGWCIIVRSTSAAAQMDLVVKEWTEETDFWRNVEAEELRVELEVLANTPGTYEYWVRQREEQAKHRPHHGLNGPEMRGLIFMADHPEINTIDKIPDVGERRMKRLLEKGLVRADGKTALGLQKWSITAEGRAEIKRENTYRNWKF